MHTVYSAAHEQHRPSHDFSAGRLSASFEIPQRALTVLDRVRATALGPVLAPESFGIAPVARVHTAEYLDFLENAWPAWSRDGRTNDLLPSVWPGRFLRHDPLPREIEAKLGCFATDTAAPITAGTWNAARAAVDVALTAAGCITDGAPAAFALCRPPGHHASADTLGGYCYLNNAAVAAQAFIDGGAPRVAILDIDYHHGNGTQRIFYARGDVLVVSIHCDPRDEYPYFAGHADETGAGAGAGANLNLPLPPGAGFDAWGAALDAALARIAAFAPQRLVVSLGVDTFHQDPISRFRLVTGDYSTIGRHIAVPGCPTLFVLEGGYAVDAMGENVVNVLQGFEAQRAAGGAGR